MSKSKSKPRTYQFRLHGKRRTLRLGPLDREQYLAMRSMIVATLRSKIKGVEMGATTAE